MHFTKYKSLQSDLSHQGLGLRIEFGSDDGIEMATGNSRKSITLVNGNCAKAKRLRSSVIRIEAVVVVWVVVVVV